MSEFGRKAAEIDLAYFNKYFGDLVEAAAPVVIRGVAAEWPLVNFSQNKGPSLPTMGYLETHYNGAPVGLLHGENISGRLFYDRELASLNFSFSRANLLEVFEGIRNSLEKDETYYVGSTTIQECFPQLLTENNILVDHPSGGEAIASIWMCNRAKVACHFDGPDNLAICAAGKRRFTLFPAAQIKNLYPGPFDLTPAGQVVSLVDFSKPDLERFPKFSEAMDAATIAELGPGDGVFIPSMWWHHVEAQSEFNVLVNYWWASQASPFAGSAKAALKHAMLSIRGMPPLEKEAWRKVFEYYVFSDSSTATEHLPESAWGSLDPSDELAMRRLRREIINSLNR